MNIFETVKYLHLLVPMWCYTKVSTKFVSLWSKKNLFSELIVAITIPFQNIFGIKGAYFVNEGKTGGNVFPSEFVTCRVY